MADPGHSRLVATEANGQLAFGHYRLDPATGRYLAHSLDVLTPWAIPMVWLVVVVGLLDTINAIIQSLRYDVFVHVLGVNWVIVTIYVPALLVSSALIFWQLTRSPVGQARATLLAGQH
jgi:hypothetical protein